MKQWIGLIKKILINGGLFALVFYFTYSMIVAKLDINEVLNIANNLDVKFLVMGVCSAMLLLVLEALVIKNNLTLLKENPKFKDCLIYAFAGNFFSAITPAATGGQPFMVLYMKKKGISISKGTLALLMDFGAYQVSILLFALIGYLLNFELINNSLGKLIPIVWIGIVLNLLLLVFVFSAIFSNKAIYRITNLIVKVIRTFSLKKSKKIEEKLLKEVSKFKECSEILKANKVIYEKNSILTLVRILLMHLGPFWIYLSMELSSTSIITLIFIQSVLYISCAVLPLPGGIGVGEQTFMFFFKTIFPASMIGGAMILSRFIGFYIIVITSGSVLLVHYIYNKIVSYKNRGNKVYENA